MQLSCVMQEVSVSLCLDCEYQKWKSQHDEPHENLRVNEAHDSSEVAYVCTECQAKFVHSKDKKNCGWLIDS